MPDDASRLVLSHDVTKARAAETALREAETWYRTTLYSIGDAVIATDRDGRIRQMNPVAEMLTGWRESDALGQPLCGVFRIVNEATRGVVENPVSRVLREGAVVGLANHTLLIARDGVERPIADSGAPIRGEDGSIVGVVLVFRDQSAERATERQLRETGARLEATLNALPDLLFELDRDGRILSYRSPSPEELYAPPEAFLGKPLAEVLPASVLDIVNRSVAAAMETGRHRGGTYLIPMADGLRRYELSASRAGERDAPDARVVILTRDTTDWHRAEEALGAESQRLSEALRVARMGCWTFEVDCGEFVFDDQYFALHRTTADAAGGHRVTTERFAREFVDPAEAHLVAAAVRAGIAATDPDFEYEIESRIVCADGDVRDVAVWFRVEKNEDGRTIRLHGVNQDITDRKRAERERERLQTQFLQSQKMESVGRLAGGVAHDFNNMLQAIIGNVELALEEARGAVRGHLEEVKAVAERSARLTRQLLAFARQQTVAPRVVNLNELVADTRAMLRRLIGEDVDLDWSPAPELWPVRVDPTQVDQILTNLVVNSRDAIRGNGSIALSTSNVVMDDSYCSARHWAMPGEYVRLEVRDSGAGMDAAAMDHLFEPFFTTKEMGKGTGLGLATVYGIVKQNAGLIDVVSVPGAGTTVSVYLPRTSAEAPAPVPKPDGRRDTGTETILLVEDEDTILSLVRTILERRGYAVTAQRTPQAALDFVRSTAAPIHLLITDVVMPGMNGQELAEQLAAIRPGVRSLFMSGYSPDDFFPERTSNRPFHFIAKPFSAAALGAAVRGAIDAP